MFSSPLSSQVGLPFSSSLLTPTSNARRARGQPWSRVAGQIQGVSFGAVPDLVKKQRAQEWRNSTQLVLNQTGIFSALSYTTSTVFPCFFHTRAVSFEMWFAICPTYSQLTKSSSTASDSSAAPLPRSTLPWPSRELSSPCSARAEPRDLLLEQQDAQTCAHPALPKGTYKGPYKASQWL